MSQQMMVFVSHAHEDDTFCRTVVEGLRGAGADVWYHEHNMASGRLSPTIERELRVRPVFVVILSPAALQSQWVQDETRWAYGLLHLDPSRVILPVLAQPLPNEDAIWPFLQDFRRIEAPGQQAYPQKEAVRQLLLALARTPAAETPTPTAAPHPTESAMGRSGPVDADERARVMTAAMAWALTNKGSDLLSQARNEEALAAFEHAVTYDPTLAEAWVGTALAFCYLKRYTEALNAIERSLSLDLSSALGWRMAQARVLRALGRTSEAEEAERREQELRGS
jgi:tetratricopeptide (TPR) repeat protein